MGDQAVTEGGEGKQASGSPDNNNNHQKGATPPPSPAIAKEDVRGTPEQLGSQNSLPPLRPDVWGVLTAISDKAKARPQGPHILLYNSEHVLGRLVKDPAYRFDSINVSGRHCTIFRKQFKADESCIPFQGSTPVSGERWLVYIKDSSSNGTFINCQKLKRDSPEARIKDGDIISLVNVPEHENAFAFLYQEVKSNVPTAVTCQTNGSILKRKSAYDEENFGESTSGDSKRVKGLGIGGLDGPVSLDDVRRLQRSNEELRNQLEAHLLTIEKLRAESRATTARHDAEIKELRETLSATFLDQIQDLRFELGKKEKEIEDYASLCAQQQSKLEDYERSLAAANQSREDADEVMKSQKLNILELKEQLEDERNQRRNDREKAEADLKAAVERARSEASEELKRQSESAARQIKENLETINKLQETDKDNRSLIEALRCKLDDTRESLVSAERTSRSLELRLQDESALLAIARKKITEKEQDLQSIATELQKEKTAKEEALAKLAALELEMETAIRDLSLEKQRLQGARERIVLRETQLRAFHSTAEEIAALQKKQEEQLKAMMKVLEDGEDENQITAENHVHENVTNAVKKESDTPARGMHGQDAEGNECSNDNNSVTMNETKNEDVDDADSQTTAGECGVHVDFTKNTLEEIENGDTQMDDLEEAKDIQVMIVLNEQKPPEPSAPVGSQAGYTQVLEMESRSLNETQLLVNTKDEAAQHKSIVVYTQLLESESNIHGKSGSGKYLQETQLLGNGKDEATQAKEVSQSYFQDKVVNGTDFEEQAGGETMQLEDEGESGSRDWEKRQTLERNQGVGHKHQQGRPPDRSVAAVPVKEEDDDVHGSDVQKQTGMRRQNGPLNTLDLLASEVPGSWAYSTPGSVHCDNAGWSQMEGGTQRGSNEGHVDTDAGKAVKPEITKEKQLSQQRGGSLGADTSTSQNSLSPRTSARHDKERRDLNVMLGIVAPDFSRLHGLDRVMETAPDSEEHTEEEDDEEHESDNESAESDPMSQSASVSARY